MAKLDASITYGDHEIQGTVTANQFSGPGGAITALNASQLTTGTLPGARFTDVSHGTRSGGNLHSTVTTTVDGFMASADKVKLNGIEAGADVNVATNLGSNRDATSYTVTSSTGDDVALVGATTLAAGLMVAADKSKLNGIEAGADVNVATNLGQSRDATSYTVTSSTGTSTTLAAATGTNAGIMVAADKSKLDNLSAGSYIKSDTNDTASGVITFNAGPIISNAAPSLKLNDTTAGSDDFWIEANANNFYVLSDRNNDGNSTTPHPLVLNNSTLGAEVYGSTVWTSANDGVGSGLNADLLDNLNSSEFLRSNATDSATGDLTFANVYLTAPIYSSGDIDTYIHFHAANQWRVVTGGSERLEVSNAQVTVQNNLQVNGVASGNGSGLTNLNASNISTGEISDARLPASISSNITGNAATASKWATTRTINLTGDVTGSANIDGSGNISIASTVDGGDADTLDTLNSTQFLRSDIANTAAGAITFSANPIISNTNPLLKINNTSSGAHDFWLQTSSTVFYIITDRNNDGNSEPTNPLSLNNTTEGATVYGNTVWTSGNDGIGSGLNADTVDNLEASQFLRSDINDQATGSLTLSNIYLTAPVYSDGDTDTYHEFHAADEWRVVTGGAERLEVNTTQVTVQNNLQVNGIVNGDGSGLTNVDAATVTGQTVGTNSFRDLTISTDEPTPGAGADGDVWYQYEV